MTGTTRFEIRENVRDADRDRVMKLLRLMIAALQTLSPHTAILLLNARDFADEEGLSEEPHDGHEIEWESETSFPAWSCRRAGFSSPCMTNTFLHPLDGQGVSPRVETARLNQDSRTTAGTGHVSSLHINECRAPGHGRRVHRALAIRRQAHDKMGNG